MNDEPHRNRIRNLIKRLEILSYIAGAASVLAAIMFYPQVLSIVPWAGGVYLVILGLYLVAQGMYLRKLRALYEKTLHQKPD